MKTVKTFARQFSFGLMMAVTLGSAVVSCDSILDEDDVDCSVEYLSLIHISEPTRP